MTAGLARCFTLELIETLIKLMRDGKYECVRGTVVQALQARGQGKRAKVEVFAGAESGNLDVL